MKKIVLLAITIFLVPSVVFLVLLRDLNQAFPLIVTALGLGCCYLGYRVGKDRLPLYPFLSKGTDTPIFNRAAGMATFNFGFYLTIASAGCSLFHLGWMAALAVLAALIFYLCFQLGSYKRRFTLHS